MGEPMNKNRIEGRRGGRAGTTQRSPGLNHGGKSGGCVKKQRVLTWGDPVAGVGDWKSAEVGVVSDKPGAGTCPLQHEHRNP